ncbi:uncharacterized protein EV420DRAFT_292184 [Desarmillaria tabescens]|uniref:receptor protein-tyrosine kinase n=1 Tax=Armillaria tabescens TaxID=1929756 RepID=A0AA39KH00_ARMTA|nr:uncharacterized protein EV420DRAFT_292184 [Desarmillaria tabescens]KAK0459825.1 hypothetical protein EV420DRAFT_292184 [Desarmillaria tabescens]
MLVFAWGILFFLFKTRLVLAQEATCNATFDHSWVYNSLNQSTCSIASSLMGACTSSTFTVVPLQEGQIYDGPWEGSDTPCLCSSVYYSLLSACAFCQNRSYASWSSWSTNCTSVYVSIYLGEIPQNTAVPHWAYQNVTTIAASDTDASESTEAVPSATATSSVTPTITASEKVKSGIIIGAVVGAFVLLAVLGLVIWLVIRRRHKPKPSKRTRGNLVEYRSVPQTTQILATVPTPYTHHRRTAAPRPSRTASERATPPVHQTRRSHRHKNSHHESSRPSRAGSNQATSSRARKVVHRTYTAVPAP